MEQEQEPPRKSSTPIKVYCLPEEKAQIAENAKAAGLSLSTFLLRVGAGFEVRDGRYFGPLEIGQARGVIKPLVTF